MKINLLICTDKDEPMFNETYSTIEEAQEALQGFEYAHDAMMDNLTGGGDE